MNNSIKGMKRTDYCARFNMENVGQTVTVFGWVQRQRDLGNLIFIDLRDRTGIIQLSFNDKTDRDVFALAQSARSEYVVAATGVVAERESKNKDIPTGDIEVIVSDFRIVSKAKTPPFEIEKSEKVGDEITLKYRYLNLRNEKLTKNILMRHEIAKIAREYFYANDFIEIETPMMIKSTPEGARDYVVPSRIHNGKFYALPQSPQIYKQLTMIAGFDRYIQLARCFRDEDLRADRQPEFTQIDLEMSFVDCDDIMNMAEGFISKLMKKTINVDVPEHLPRMTFADAMNKYGSDKPDTRFDMLIQDISDWADNTDFVVFKSAIADGGSVKAIVAKNAASVYTRKKIDKLTASAKGIGAKGLVVFIVSDKTGKALTVMGALRLMVAKELDIIPEGKWNFLWITEMPFFEMDEETGEWVAAHHPFTMPMEESIQYLDTDKSKVKAQAFDLVLNGTELSSGSMRITDTELQTKMFELLGMQQEEIDAKFGFLVDAYQYAAPPHGGMGIGLDRLAMLICGADSLRDVVAFPKVQNASELMSGAPSYIDDVQLCELGIDIKETERDAE